MYKQIAMLRVQDGELDAVVNFLKSHLPGTQTAQACVLMLLPLHTPPYPVTADQYVPPPGLTPREFSVLQAVADGQSNAQIACQLNTTVGSVKGIIQTLFRKLGVRANRRSALVRAAIDSHAANPGSEPAPPSNAALTPMETSILDAIGQGKTDKDIALCLNMPQIAVKAAIRRIRCKLGATTRKQLAAYFRQPGTSSAG